MNKLSCFASRAALVIAVLIGPMGGSARADERAHVTLLCTTDLHGHIYPIDYYTGKTAELGVAKIATMVARARSEFPHLLLLDCGDTIQGTPLVYYHNRKDNSPIDPMMLVMNELRYDSMTVGNHEYNFGLAVLAKARGEAKFPWISANTYRAGTGDTAYKPYIVKEVEGVRIGILGLTTPGIPAWENPENYAGLEFRDPIEEAAKWVPILRGREHVDAVVVAMHMGLEEDLGTGKGKIGDVPHENAGLAIARQVPGIDLILLGHTHRDVASLVVSGVLLTQAGRWGDHLVEADLYFSREGSGSWTIIGKAAQSLPVEADIPADPKILALAEPYHAETLAWLNKPIGTSDRAIETGDSLHDSAMIDLIQRVQLEAGHADVSLASSFNPNARIPAGPVTVRDIAGLYVYENTLFVIEVTGAQLRAALEHSARYFLPYQAGKSPAELIDPNVMSYNYDAAEGVTYEIDITRPVGERIRNLSFKGAPLDPTARLKLALNNYRFNGGGGYTMFKNAPVLSHTSEEIRDLIIDWVERHHTIPGEPTGNWRVIY
jgi:2',3'-cyclic-nucleotide 2'-phosphodiesterase/3'-nucleotidase